MPPFPYPRLFPLTDSLSLRSAVMDRAVGNTGGLGGVFGLMWAIGKSPFQFPEGRPWKPSWQYRFFMFISNFMQKFAKKKDD